MVEAFTPSHGLSCYQLVADHDNKTFTCYLGLRYEGQPQMNFAPQIYRGGGQELPEKNRKNVTYETATEHVGHRMKQLELLGYSWKG